MNFLNSLVTASILLSLSSVTSYANDTLNLRSTTGVSIKLTFKKAKETLKSNPPMKNILIKDLTISASGISPKRSVEAVIILKTEAALLCEKLSSSSQKVMKIELKYDSKSNAFIGDYATYGYYYGEYGMLTPVAKVGLDQIRISSESKCYNEKSVTELALVVDGVWQKDPINKTNNFKLNF